MTTRILMPRAGQGVRVRPVGPSPVTPNVRGGGSSCQQGGPSDVSDVSENLK